MFPPLFFSGFRTRVSTGFRLGYRTRVPMGFVEKGLRGFLRVSEGLLTGSRDKVIR